MKLKAPETRPAETVKLDLSPELAGELEQYGVYYGTHYGEEIGRPEMIRQMLTVFLSSDRAFRSWKRGKAPAPVDEDRSS